MLYNFFAEVIYHHSMVIPSFCITKLFYFGNYYGLAINGTANFKNVKNCLNTNIYSYLETSVSQSLNLYLNVVHFFNTSVH